MADRTLPRELTGRHVLLIAVTAFGVIVTANMAMLFAATGSFPGLVVANSHVAGVGWDARASAQRAMGWTLSTAYGDGAVVVRITGADGAPVTGLDLTATLGRPATDVEDRVLAFSPGPDGYRAAARLDPGLWRLHLASTEPAYAQTVHLSVPGDR